MNTLTDVLFQSLVAQLEYGNTAGMTLAGSYALNEGRLLQDILLPGDAAVINRTTEIILEAGI